MDAQAQSTIANQRTGANKIKAASCVPGDERLGREISRGCYYRAMQLRAIAPDDLAARCTRRLRREQRRAARDLARRRNVEALARLLEGADEPEGFTAEQVQAYRDELHRLYRRSVPHAHARGPA